MTEEKVASDEGVGMAKQIVQMLLQMECPKESEALEKWKDNIYQFRNFFLEKLWKENPNSVIQCLNIMYKIMANDSRSLTHSCWVVFDSVKSSKMPDIVEGILNERESNQNSKIECALVAIIHGLCSCGPQYPGLQTWVLSIIKSLEDRRNFIVLTKVADRTIQKLISAFYLPVFRKHIYPILKKFLYSVATPLIFNNPKTLEQILLAIKVLAKGEDEATKSCLSEFGALVNILMERFPEPSFESKYNEIREKLLECPPGELDCDTMIIWEIEDDWVGASSWSMSRGNSRTPYKGLVNLGNTCFMNSVVQMLYMNIRFRNEILEKQVDDSELAVKQLQQLFALMRESERPVLTPMRVMDATLPPTFRSGQQQDSSEYLIYLLDNIHECESKIIRRTRPNRSPIQQGEDKKHEEGATAAVLDNQSTMVQRLFGGELVSTTTCDTCKKHFPKADSFRDLALAFPDHTKIWDVQELIEICLRPEILNKENMYECSSCGGMRQATRTHSVTKAPMYLILILKLFRFDPIRKQRLKLHGRLKNLKTIQLPVNNCNSGSPSQAGSTTFMTYDLKSVVLHSGSSLDGGHYFASAIDHMGQWYVFNDSHVSSASSAWVIGNGTPYVLMLKRADMGEDQVFTPLQPFLQLFVNRDNQKFLSEQQQKYNVQSKAIIRRGGSEEDWDDDDSSSFSGGPSLVF